MSEKVLMTPEGHAFLKAKLERLKLEMPKVSAEIGTAREHGDLRENAEYHAAKEKQGMVEARINEIEDRISRADVIDPSTFSGDKVKFGAWVTLEDADSGKKVRYRILGPDEADLKKGTISVTSPIARALIGRKVGDEVTVNAPGGERVYEIVEVAWSA